VSQGAEERRGTREGRPETRGRGGGSGRGLQAGNERGFPVADPEASRRPDHGTHLSVLDGGPAAEWDGWV